MSQWQAAEKEVAVLAEEEMAKHGGELRDEGCCREKGSAITAIQALVVISTLRGPRMAARCVLILLINHYNMQYNSEVYLLFRPGRCSLYRGGPVINRKPFGRRHSYK